MSARTVVAAAAAVSLVGVALVVNAADAARVPVVDGFDRTVAAGWGATAAGDAWVRPSGPFASRVKASTAQVDLAARRETRARLKRTDFADPALTATFVVPSWGSYFAGLESRIQSNGAAYRSRLYVRKDSVVEVEVLRRSADGVYSRLCAAKAGMKAVAGEQLRLESRTSGTNPVQILVRAWKPGARVPAWQVTCRDSSSARLTRPGSVGIAFYSGTGGTLSVADFRAADAAAGQVAPAVSPAPPTTQASTAKPSAAATTASRPATSARPAMTSARPSAVASTVRPSPSATATAARATTAAVPTARAAAATVPAPASGSLPVGQARYAVPADALHVAVNGSDSAAGSATAPMRTLKAAIARAASGRTIVLHAGSYREAGLRVPEGKALTIQNAPGEAVWLDGATTVSGFVATGSTWTKSGWTTQFDTSPTFTRGAADSTTKNWQFVSASYPMAAHPDQVWINGARQTQVASASAVRPGTFYVDRAGDKLILGTSPVGKTVTASVLGDALTILGNKTTVRGIGLRNYAPSVPDQGAITLYASGVTLENVDVRDVATGGIGVFRANSTLRRVSVARAGQLAIMGNLADNTLLDRVRVSQANVEHFNQTPAAGSIKFTTSRGLTLRNSVITGGTGNGFWADESCYDVAVVNSDITNNTGRGVFIELSEKAVIVNNRITGNGDDQIRIANSARVDVWNNSISGASLPIMVGQDARKPGDTGYARDQRRPNPDPEMTWAIKGVTIGNNVVESSGAVNALVRVEDWSGRFTGAQMVSTLESNVYTRLSTSPRWVLAWAAPGNPKVFTTVPEIGKGIGRETKGQGFSGRSVLGANGAVRSDAGVVASKASSLPPWAVSRSGFQTSPGRVGAIR